MGDGIMQRGAKFPIMERGREVGINLRFLWESDVLKVVLRY